MATICFFGLGNMGGPMAANLVAAGHRVVGLDLKDENREKAAETGVVVDQTQLDALTAADVVITMLPAGPAVAAVYDGPEGVIAKAKDGALLIDCSTIDVATSRLIAIQAEAVGLALVDAPVSGGVGAAVGGTLTFMVGGVRTAFDRAEPILKAMGKNIIHTGGSGTGQAAKICNNMVLGISMIAVSEAFALADRLGLDRQTLFDVSSKASGQCWSLTTYCPVPGPVPTSPANRDYAPGFTAAMMLKDLHLAQMAAEGVGGRATLGAEAAALYQRFVESGGKNTDFSGIFQMLSSDGGRSTD